jgi:hypothetical protein
VEVVDLNLVVVLDQDLVPVQEDIEHQVMDLVHYKETDYF